MTWVKVKCADGDLAWESGALSERKFIFLHGGRYHVASGVSFETLDEAKAYFNS